MSHQIGQGGYMSYVRLDAGPRIDNYEIYTIGPRRLQDAAQLGRICFHQRGRLRLSCSPPTGGAALRIKIHQ